MKRGTVHLHSSLLFFLGKHFSITKIGKNSEFGCKSSLGLPETQFGPFIWEELKPIGSVEVRFRFIGLRVLGLNVLPLTF